MRPGRFRFERAGPGGVSGRAPVVRPLSVRGRCLTASQRRSAPFDFDSRREPPQRVVRASCRRSPWRRSVAAVAIRGARARTALNLNVRRPVARLVSTAEARSGWESGSHGLAEFD
ncbi:hypothetical protein HPB47_012380 [Ixodes persulcatus]|uniref:Uncharacterized protein n=1 Tax=Ixodes persulcatus TaxID=34615 RepID=A0AC60NTT7_IXOPE|nr:hypothetical protein HPB47_012380 [Ixodes persulcatus]